MNRTLPPLNAIRAFEVAARHLNFSRASEEIGVTPGAISKQIILLEDFIGAKLFERLPGQLTLTSVGYALKDSVGPVFDKLDQAFERYSRRPPRSNVCRISTLASFASQFIAPRLDRFKEALPHIELEILTSQRLVEFAREEIDFSVRYGLGQWDDSVATPLVEGTLVPVCAPGMLAELEEHGMASFILSNRRVQLYATNEWEAWLNLCDIDLKDAPCPFIAEDSLVAISIALAGQGIALLPEILIRGHMACGNLRMFSDVHLPWKPTYYITHAPNADRNPINEAVIGWLRSEVASG